ncbi:hypothetical protein [Clostridium sp.]
MDALEKVIKLYFEGVSVCEALKNISESDKRKFKLVVEKYKVEKENK